MFTRKKPFSMVKIFLPAMCDSLFQIDTFCRIVGASDPCRSRLLDGPFGHFFVRR